MFSLPLVGASNYFTQAQAQAHALALAFTPPSPIEAFKRFKLAWRLPNGMGHVKWTCAGIFLRHIIWPILDVF